MKEYLIATFILLIYFSPVFYQLSIVVKERKKGNKKPLKKLIKFFKYTFVILTSTLICFTILNHTNYLDYEKPATFDKYNDITFENFRGFEFLKKTLYGSKKFAYVVTSIEAEFDDNSVTIYSLFHPSRSFVYKKKNNSKELLSHEKYHIKITELFTRKAKKQISLLEKFDENKINEIIKNIKEKENNFQQEYDYNTFHSYVLSEQKKYEKAVDSLLNLLSAFKKPKIEFYEKK